MPVLLLLPVFVSEDALPKGWLVESIGKDWVQRY